MKKLWMVAAATKSVNILSLKNEWFYLTTYHLEITLRTSTYRDWEPHEVSIEWTVVSGECVL